MAHLGNRRPYFFRGSAHAKDTGPRFERVSKSDWADVFCDLWPDGRAIVFYIVNGEVRRLGKYLHIRNHSPDGHEWGYVGSGPAQCSLAILMHVTRNRRLATAAYQDFKTAVIGTFEPLMGPDNRFVAELTGKRTREWELSESWIRNWISRWQRENETP